MIKCQSLVASSAVTARFIWSVALPPTALLAILHPRIIDLTSLCESGLLSLQTLHAGRSASGRRGGGGGDGAHPQTAAGEPLAVERRYFDSGTTVRLCCCTFQGFKIVPSALHFKALFITSVPFYSSLPRLLQPQVFKSAVTCALSERRTQAVMDTTVCNNSV